MESFDYASAGELYYPRRSGFSRRPGITYRRFATAAEALRFVIEGIPAPALTGCYLEVEGERYEVSQMRALYESAEYPLPRLEKQDDDER